MLLIISSLFMNYDNYFFIEIDNFVFISYFI